VLWGISWINIQMMLADMPRYNIKKNKPGEKDKKTKTFSLGSKEFVDKIKELTR